MMLQWYRHLGLYYIFVTFSVALHFAGVIWVDGKKFENSCTNLYREKYTPLLEKVEWRLWTFIVGVVFHICRNWNCQNSGQLPWFSFEKLENELHYSIHYPYKKIQGECEVQMSVLAGVKEIYNLHTFGVVYVCIISASTTFVDIIKIIMSTTFVDIIIFIYGQKLFLTRYMRHFLWVWKLYPAQNPYCKI